MKSNALGPGLLTFGESGTLKEFAAKMTAVALEPSYSDGDAVDFLDGSTDQEPDEETWALTGTLQQELIADALEDWCLENAGKEMPFTFVPVGSATDKHYSGIVRIRAVTIGGDVKAKNTSDIEFPIIGGRPTLHAGTGA